MQFDTAYLDVKRSTCLEMLDSRENFCQFEGVCPTTTPYHHPECVHSTTWFQTLDHCFIPCQLQSHNNITVTADNLNI